MLSNFIRTIYYTRIYIFILIENNICLKLCIYILLTIIIFLFHKCEIYIIGTSYKLFNCEPTSGTITFRGDPRMIKGLGRVT